MPEITIQSNDGASHRFPLNKDRVTIGRSRENDIFLPDQWLSRHHAEIHRDGEGFSLKDLGSKNGTLLNGSRIAAQERLRTGDVITLGEHTLTFHALSVDEPEEFEPIGTRVFSARELSDVKTKPVVDPSDLVRQNRLLQILSGAAESLLEHKPLPELFDRVLQLLFDAVPAERAAILLLEGPTRQPVIKASRSRIGNPITRVSRSIARRAIEQKVSLILPNLLEDAAFRTQDSILSSGIRSALVAPLWYAGEIVDRDPIGLVYMDSLQRSHSFSDDDLRVITALANVAAAKIENARLLEESLVKRQLEDEMRKAAEIQRRLLPSVAPTVKGYEICGSNRPCRTVGGDYYDFICESGKLHLALGDVSGKGTGAALLMTVLRAAVRAHWTEFEPAEAMARINRTVCQNVTEGKYVTFFMARLDPATGQLTYVNAGQNPPILVRASEEVKELEEGGMVLGMFEAVPYSAASVELGPGDTLVVFSDGVSETWNGTEEEFGVARLVEVVRRGRALSAAGLEAEILRALEEYAAGARAMDDRTLIVLKRLA
ncbi:MAG TPA: SpoIIE family protein phosphatase [Vicinamibacteria bacterium]|nr:SpoIIE family protein phosphatase [Vicinamibacteria bacterium]